MVNPFIWLVLTFIDLYMWIVIIGVVLSWLVAFNVVNTTNRFVYMVGDFTHRATEPALGRIRRYIPNLGGMDISPIVLIILLMFLQRFILWGFAQGG
ncbi:MAG TPA: YggT family protein [Rhodospirillales bacterium]|jgi:YggT family protein|nr:YggT family protein [Rhodospirillales bacterium]